MIGALVELLNNSYQSGNLAHVEVIARTLCAAIPDDVVSLQILGLAYLKTGRTADALKLFRKADRKNRHTPDIEPLADGGTQLESAATACYREATRKHAGLGRLWYDLGIALLSLKRPRQSIWAFRAALAARPAFPAALMALGSAGIKVGDHDAARDGFTGLLAIEPGNAIALRGLEKVTLSSSSAEDAPA
ncbi:MAG: tetratricopeptide repeat protein [Rugosibacter sp.]